MAMQEAAFPVAVAPKQSSTGLFVMTALLLGFGFWVIYPIVLTLVISFNAAPLGLDPVLDFVKLDYGMDRSRRISFALEYDPYLSVLLLLLAFQLPS